MRVSHSADLESGELVELASGIDTLYLSGRADLPETMVTQLTSVKERAERERAPVRVRFGQTEVAVNGWGRQKYRYCLEHPHGWIGLHPGGHLPEVRIEPNSEALHGLGPAQAVDWFTGLVESACGRVDWTVNRLDVYSDWQGWALKGNDRDRFLCRAHACRVEESNGRLETLQFGRRKTNTISARIYDKTVEITQKGTDFWPEIWGQKFRVGSPVLRVEFECGRTGLRQLGVRTPAQALASVGGIWRYATGEFLTLRDRGLDSNKSRWPQASEWRQVSNASLGQGAQGLKRMYSGRLNGDLRKLAPFLNGALGSFGAIIGASSIDETVAYVPEFLREYERSMGQPFMDRVTKKRRWIAS